MSLPINSKTPPNAEIRPQTSARNRSDHCRGAALDVCALQCGGRFAGADGARKERQRRSGRSVQPQARLRQAAGVRRFQLQFAREFCQGFRLAVLFVSRQSLQGGFRLFDRIQRAGGRRPEARRRAIAVADGADSRLRSFRGAVARAFLRRPPRRMARRRGARRFHRADERQLRDLGSGRTVFPFLQARAFSGLGVRKRVLSRFAGHNRGCFVARGGREIFPFGDP